MFYFVTHNNNGAKQGPFDVTKILAADPEHPKWGGGTHYWGEPEAGYYIMKDEWIVRRHARQLCDAGVDLIVLDNTNDHIYEDVFCFIADVFRRMRAEGEPDAADRVSSQSEIGRIALGQNLQPGPLRRLVVPMERQAAAVVRAACHRESPASERRALPESDYRLFHDSSELGMDDAPLVRRRSRRMALGRPLSSVVGWSESPDRPSTCL